MKLGVGAGVAVAGMLKAGGIRAGTAGAGAADGGAGPNIIAKRSTLARYP
jgi:hypothetical protein